LHQVNFVAVVDMGASVCKSAEKSEDGIAKTQATKRHSFCVMKRQASQAAVIKLSDDFDGGYQKGSQLGADDKVFNVTSTMTEVSYCARAIPKDQMPIQDITVVEEHLTCLTSLYNAHLCRFVEAFDVGDHFYMLYEKAKEQSVFQYEKDLRSGKPLDPEQVQVYCRQITMALKTAHSQDVVHGRLSESSIVMDVCDGEADRSVKVCDIGQTFVLRPLRASQKLDYEAPETLWDELPKPGNTQQLRAAVKSFMSLDMWALGVLMFRMLTGKFPFKKATKDCIHNDAVEFGEEWDQMPDAKDAINSLLRKHGRIRLSADRLLKHPWLMLSRDKVSKSKMMRVLQNVLANTYENTFKKFALRMIAEGIEPEKLEIVQRAFRFIDKNGDGNLSVQEISEALRKYGEDEDEAVAVFEAIDRDGSGSLSFAEFTAVSIGRQEYCDKETLWHAFKRMDKDDSGNIDKAELQRMVREVEHLSKQDEIDCEVESIAKDVTLPVDFDAFVHVMTAPVGASPSSVKMGLDRCCYTVLKVDNHGVRHIEPKEFSMPAGSPLNAAIYSKQTLMFGGKSPGKWPTSPGKKPGKFGFKV